MLISFKFLCKWEQYLKSVKEIHNRSPVAQNEDRQLLLLLLLKAIDFIAYT